MSIGQNFKYFDYKGIIYFIYYKSIDFRHTITVQHTALDRGKVRNPSRPNSPPGSPSIPRLRAIACEYFLKIFSS